MAKDSKGDENRDINIAREVFDETFFSEDACSSHEEPKDCKQKMRAACERLKSCSWNGFRRVLWSLFPILDWLPKYKLKEDLLPDITGGITVGIMHIPQGMPRRHNFARVFVLVVCVHVLPRCLEIWRLMIFKIVQMSYLGQLARETCFLKLGFFISRALFLTELRTYKCRSRLERCVTDGSAFRQILGI